MLTHPQFNPVAVSVGPFDIAGHVIGPLSIHWYGITYMVAFACFYFLAQRRAMQPWFAREGWQRRDVEDLLFLGVLGVVLGGRLGFVLFYDLARYLRQPADILKVWQGGMSFHGGMLGVAVAMAWFARSRGRPWLQVIDLIAPCVPIGLASGRVGNFINGELWGRPAPEGLPWAMIFPQDGSVPPIARHPSQIYQFLGEGLLLFVLLQWYGRKERASGQVAGAFAFGYGVLRFSAEFFREPDRDLVWLRDSTGLSMGQWLCVPMIAFGGALWWWARRRGAGAGGAPSAGQGAA